MQSITNYINKTSGLLSVRRTLVTVAAYVLAGFYARDYIMGLSLTPQNATIITVAGLFIGMFVGFAPVKLNK